MHKYSKILVDRQSIRDEIEWDLRYFRTTDKRLEYIHGEPGVGKTILLQYIYEYLAKQSNEEIKNSPYIAKMLSLKECRLNKIEILRSLYHALKSDVQFPIYEFALNKLYACTTDEKFRIYELSENNKTADFINDIYPDLIGLFPLDKFSDIMNISIKSLTYLREILKNHLTKKEVIENIKHSFSELLDSVTSYKDIEYNLPKYFIYDVNNYISSTGTRIAIMINDYDNHYISPDEDSKVQWMETQLFEKSVGVFWVLAGLQERRFAASNNLVVRTYHVMRFRNDEVCEYNNKELHPIIIMADNAYIKDRDVQNKIKEISQGLPALTSLMIEHYHDRMERNGEVLLQDFDFEFDEDKTGGIYKSFFERYCSSYMNKSEQKVLSYLSVFQVWNRDVYNSLNNSYRISNDIDMFSNITDNTAIVSKLNNTDYCFKEGIAKVLRNTLTENEKSELFNFAYQYYKAKTELLINEFSHDFIQKLHASSMYAIEYGTKIIREKDAFSEFSQWYLKTEQKFTKLGLYTLKADVIKLYLENTKEMIHYDDNLHYYFSSLYDLGWAYKYIGDYEAAVEILSRYFTELTTKCSITDSRAIRILYSLGKVFYSMNKPEDAMQFLKWAKERAAEHNDVQYLSYILNTLGYIYMQNGESSSIAKAKEYFEESLMMFDNNGHKFAVYKNLIRLNFQNAWKYSDTCEYGKAEEYFETLKTIANSSINKNEDLLWIKMAEICLSTERELLHDSLTLDRIKGYLTDIEEIYRQIDMRKNSLRIINFMIINNMGVLYAMALDTDKAIQYLKTAYYYETQIYSGIPDKLVIKKTKENISMVENAIITEKNHTNQLHILL